MARGQTYVVSSSWVTPASVDSLVVPPGVDAARFKYVYALFDPSSGRVAVGVFDATESDLRKQSWIFGVHNAVKEALRAGGGDKIGTLGQLLADRLRALSGTPYGGEIDIFIDMLSGTPPGFVI